jgi:hypothetical protein
VFTYSVSADNGTATGRDCATFGLDGSDWDGGEYGLGFSETYNGYDLGAVYIYMEQYAEYGFFIFSLDYPPNYEVTGDRTSATWKRIMMTRSGYPYYAAY